MFDGKTIYFFIRGIAGHPSDQLEWEWRAADWLNQHCPDAPQKARSVSYATQFFSVWIRRKARALQFAKVLRGYTRNDWRVVIVAHSEGTVLALDSLRHSGWPRIEELHLVCGACDSDFDRNGLNWALRMGAVDRVHCYMAGEDVAMKWENLVLGKLLFGISDRSMPLGLHGPRSVDKTIPPSRLFEHRSAPWDQYGHSDCWLKENFDRTMNQICRQTH